MGVFCYDKRDNVGFTWILTTQWGRQSVTATSSSTITYSIAMQQLLYIGLTHSAGSTSDTVKSVSVVSAGPSSTQIITDAASGTVGLIYGVIGRS